MKKFKVSSIEFDFEGGDIPSKKEQKQLNDYVINKIWEVSSVDDEILYELPEVISDDTDWLIKGIEYDEVEKDYNNEETG